MFTSDNSPAPSGLALGLWGTWPQLTAIIIVFIVFIVLTSPATAQIRLSQLDKLCSGQQTNVEFKDCLYRQYLAVDRELNQVWKQVIAAIRKSDYLEPKTRKAWEGRLREAQRNWVRFKEIDCNEAVGYEWWGGTGAGSAISFCLIRHTVLRTENLTERYLADR